MRMIKARRVSFLPVVATYGGDKPGKKSFREIQYAVLEESSVPQRGGFQKLAPVA